MLEMNVMKCANFLYSNSDDKKIQRTFVDHKFLNNWKLLKILFSLNKYVLKLN